MTFLEITELASPVEEAAETIVPEKEEINLQAEPG